MPPVRSLRLAKHCRCARALTSRLSPRVRLYCLPTRLRWIWQRGVDAGVLSVHTLRPLDTEAILAAARRSQALVTVEEHSVYGGLGSTVASLLMQAGLFRPLKIVGLPDEYTYTGSQLEIFAHYGISPAGLAQTAQTLLATSQRMTV